VEVGKQAPHRFSPVYPILNSTPSIGKVRSRADQEGRVRLRAMVAKGMHKLASEGPKQAVQSRDVRWLSGNGLRTWIRFLDTGGGSHLRLRVKSVRVGVGACASICLTPPPPTPRENCITSQTSGLSVLDSQPNLSVSDPFTPLALLVS